jgi:hypothetical protein
MTTENNQVEIKGTLTAIESSQRDPQQTVVYGEIRYYGPRPAPIVTLTIVLDEESLHSTELRVWLAASSTLRVRLLPLISK